MIKQDLPIPPRLPGDMLHLLTHIDKSIASLDMAERTLNLVFKLSPSADIAKQYPFDSETLLDVKTDLLKIREFYRQQLRLVQPGGISNTARMLQNATNPVDYDHLATPL